MSVPKSIIIAAKRELVSASTGAATLSNKLDFAKSELREAESIAAQYRKKVEGILNELALANEKQSDIETFLKNNGESDWLHDAKEHHAKWQYWPRIEDES